jgi:endogenous inhibitor of DNA gyrase (YacG/DUF329 family)
MPKWKFWEKSGEDRPVDPIAPAPRTARAGEGIPEQQPERPARRDVPIAVDPDRRAALVRRRDAMQFDVDQARLANQPDNPWRRRMALLAETMAVVEGDRARLVAEPRVERPALPPTPVAVGEVRHEDPALVVLRGAGEEFRFETDQDWAERGFQIARTELSRRAGDPAALIPGDLAPDLHDPLVAHLEQSLFTLATDLRRRAEDGVVMPEVTLDALASPCPTCGDWRAWGGHCPTCADRASRQRDLDAELDRLRVEREREEADRAEWTDRLPIALRRLADAQAALDAAGG